VGKALFALDIRSGAPYKAAPKWIASVSRETSDPVRTPSHGIGLSADLASSEVDGSKPLKLTKAALSGSLAKIWFDRKNKPVAIILLA